MASLLGDEIKLLTMIAMGVNGQICILLSIGGVECPLPIVGGNSSDNRPARQRPLSTGKDSRDRDLRTIRVNAASSAKHAERARVTLFRGRN